MNFAESTAKSIMSREFGYTYTLSYQRRLELGFTGFTDSYLNKVADLGNLATTAKMSVVRELARCDLLGIEIFRGI